MIDKIVALHRALRSASIPHAFGGALALGWCVREPRTTADIDLNIFVSKDRIDEVLAVLPGGVVWGETQVHQLRRDGQARLIWDATPVDLFFTTDEFHVAVARRCQEHAIAGEVVPYLACADLAVFKAFFDRDKDWIDLAAMLDAGTIDPAELAATISDYLGPDDQRLVKLARLPEPPRPTAT